jgi:hypothetical protein
MQSTVIDRNGTCAASVHAAFRALYLVSGAAAQLGAHGLRIEDNQWQALEQAARNANTALLAHEDAQGDAMAAIRRLSTVCDHLLERRATGHPCPSTVWRDLMRAGRDAYEQLEL